MANNDNQSTLIKNIKREERPREKAVKYGIESLTDVELMALIFSTGIPGKSVIDLCREILDDHNNSLDLITNLSIKSICERYKGVGVAKATTFLAGLTLGKRAAQERNAALAKEAVNRSEKAYYLMRNKFVGLQHEEFWIMLFNHAGKDIGKVMISRGGTAATSVDVKLILKAAIDHLASSMILFHNHPSGTLYPSREDDTLTRKIKEAAALVDIRVNDHIIITDTNYYSYADNGRL